MSIDGSRYSFLTQKERDIETELDYFLARYYSSIQGRFTSPDEFNGGPQELYVLGSSDNATQALPYAQIVNPQSLNKYQYTYNNPLQYIDPDGHQTQEKKSLTDQLLELLGRIWRGSGRHEDGMIPTSGDGEFRKDQNTFLDMNADRMVVNFLRDRGEVAEAYLDLMELADR